MICSLLLTAALAAAGPGQDPLVDPVAGPPLLQPPQELPVEEVVFEGLETYSEQGVLAALGIRIGEPYPESMRSGLLKVWDTYKIVVGEPRLTRIGEGLRVTLPVTELPLDLEPRFVGHSEVDLEKLKEWALLFDREQVYLHEADAIRSRLMAGYRQAGHYFVEIDKVIGGLGEGVAGELIFEIREGPKVRCTGIEVSGNTNLPNTGWGLWSGGLFSLAELSTKGRGIFRWWGGVFDREVLDADIVAMREVYRERGWLDATVTIDSLDFSADRERVVVKLIVDEGPLWRVGSLNILGVDPDDLDAQQDLFFTVDELQELTELKAGVPFEQARIVHDMGALMLFYGERGYLEQSYFEDASAGGSRFLNPDVVYDWDTHEVHVTYRLVQGRKRFIGEVRVNGNTYTKDKVVRRELDFNPGDQANIGDIQRGLARVRRTNYFDDPYDPTHAPPIVVFQVDEDDPDIIDVEYRLSEGRVVDFNISGGVASDSGVVGLITLSMRNFAIGNLPSGFWSAGREIYDKEAFHGNGEQLAIDLSPGSQVSFWRFMYAHPDALGTHHDRFVVRTEALGRDRRFNSHDESKSEASLTVARLFGAGDLSLRIGPRWSSITVDDLTDPADSPSTLVNSQGKTDLRGLTVDLSYDRLDSRISPREGSYYRWSNTYYGGALGGDENFLKTELNYSHYFLLGEVSDDLRPGFYLGAGAGFSDTFGDTDQVHYSERFFLGGNSLRGFDFRGIGPMEGRYALGGESMARATIEYRHPIYSTPIAGTSRRREMFRIVTFLDAGVLGVDGWDLNPDEVRASVGFGFGLVNPLPLTFSFGFPINEQDGDLRETFSFSLDLRR